MNSRLKTTDKSVSPQDDLDYIAVRWEDDDSRVLIVTSVAEPPALISHGKSNSHKPVPDEDRS